MHVGEKYKLYIPSELAYGAQSPSPSIPANSVLVFDLELLAIKDPAKEDDAQVTCVGLNTTPRLAGALSFQEVGVVNPVEPNVLCSLIN